MSTLMSLVLLLLMVVVRRKSLRMSLDVRVLLVILMVLTGAMMLLMLMLLLLLRIYWILWVRCRRLVTVLLMPLMLFLPLLLSLRMGMVLSRLRPVIGGRIPLMLLLLVLVGRSTAPVLGICLLVPLDGRMRQGRRMRICFRRSSAGRSALICGSCRSTALLLLMRLMSVLVVRWRRAILTAAVLSVVVVHGLLPLALALTLNLLLLLLRLLLTG